MNCTYKYLFHDGKPGREPLDCVDSIEYFHDHLHPNTLLVLFDSTLFNYRVFRHHGDLYAYVRTLPQYTLHEVIFAGYHQKPKFDLDNCPEGLLSDLLDAVINAFRLEYGITPTFAVTVNRNGCIITPNKYHVIVTNCCFPDTATADCFDRESFRPLLTPALLQCIDRGINKSTQNFRLFGSFKATSGVKQSLPRDRWTEHDIVEATLENTNVLDTRGLRVLPARLPKYAVQEPVNGEPPKDALAAATQYAGTAFKYRTTRGSILVFDRLHASHCEFCQAEHQRDNTLFFTATPTRVYARCRRSKESRLILCIDKATKRQSFKALVDAYVERAAADAFTPLLRAKTVICDCPVSDMPVDWNHRLIGIRANMKMGKTRLIQRHVGSLPPAQRVVVVSFRQTLTYDLYKKFPDFVVYSAITGEISLERYPRVIVQVESLHRLRHSTNAVLIVDESESVIEQFGSPTVVHVAKCLAVFRLLMNTCTQCIYMDATLSQRSVDLILRPDTSTTVYVNGYKNMTEDTIIVMKSRSDLIKCILEALSKNKRIVIPTNSKRFASGMLAVVRKEYPTKSAVMYDSETPRGVKSQHFSDVDKYWLGHDVLIYTPTCSAGVSFEIPWYDAVYAYFTDQSTTVESCRQSLYRVRNVASGEYHVCVNARPRDVVTDISKYETVLLKDIALITDADVRFEYDIDPIAGTIVPTRASQVYNIFLHNRYYGQLSRCDFLYRFVSQSIQTGVAVSAIDQTDSAIAHKMYKMLDVLAVDVANAIGASPDLSPAMVAAIYNELKPTLEDQYALGKYFLAKFYGVGNVTAEFVLKYNTPKTRLAYTNLSFVVGDRDQNLAALRKYEAECVYARKYVVSYPQHRLAVRLLEMCGYVDLTSEIKPADMETNLKAARTLLVESTQLINENFRTGNPLSALPEPDSKNFVRATLAAVNSILHPHYGIKICKKIDGARYPYTLRHEYLGILFNTPSTPQITPASANPLYTVTAHEMIIEAAIDYVNAECKDE